MSSDRFLTHVAAYVIIRNEKNEILLQKRANTGFLDGYWDFPSGHVEPGETLIAAAVRELEEEVCLTTNPEDIQLVHINQNFLDLPYLNFTFLATAWAGEPGIGEPDKISELSFFAPDSLPELCSLGVRVVEQAGFPDTLTYSSTSPDNFEAVMHEPFDITKWGKK